jgi:hypothetical protein
MRRVLCSAIVLGLMISAGLAQEVKSGPQAGTVLPAPFDALNINGKIDGKDAAGRQHCLVCQNGLNPTVMVFTREPAEGKDAALTDLLKQLDDTLAKHQDSFLGGFAVFLSPQARSSLTEAETKDVNQILEEAKGRIALEERLKARAAPLKHVIVAAMPDKGPKDYNLNPKAETTVIFYHRLKVIANWSFEEGKLTDKDVTAALKKVDETVAAIKKKE